ncbi:hypothetical protein [Motilimonas eburnea]|uniref:hypothetical protein n=1 Tax=Motilimonas eburnea TaxID=1737488 RepID=UPI001E2F1B53|nr:hypothetical protein [Motilimonas eburnea]MCE2571728.1 hypothetical protein [Motilimonas eburnea]
MTPKSTQPKKKRRAKLTKMGNKNIVAPKMEDGFPKGLKESLKDILREDKHGLSFNSDTSVQMRFMRDGKNLGEVFVYGDHGGVNAAVERAIRKVEQFRAVKKRADSYRRGAPVISKPQQVRLSLQESIESDELVELLTETDRSEIDISADTRNDSTKFEGVRYVHNFDKRRNKTERRYEVVTRDLKGKQIITVFSLGYKDFDAEWQLHAYRTAIQFRKEYEVYGANMYRAKYKHWKERRLYVQGYPFTHRHIQDYAKKTMELNEAIAKYQSHFSGVEGAKLGLPVLNFASNVKDLFRAKIKG